jgi:2-polyprenyl-3-methyl-5-hydroxy-6-metoxy-1,4-benzoquinol methylase
MTQPAAQDSVGKPQGESSSPRPPGDSVPNPSRIFQTLHAFHQTAAMRAAIELDIFTTIGDRHTTAEEIAIKTGAAERGIRILCDFLTIMGFLTKQGSKYGLTPDSGMFLDRESPAYMGTIAQFLGAPEMVKAFDHLADAVRKGGTVMSEQGTISRENPIWVQFARSMAPMMMMPAEIISMVAGADKGEKCRVLDIAAGHGLFGINIARHNPQAEIVALDWPGVLEVAMENARKSGVEARYSVLPGSAFEVDFGEGYDLVLLTNFLHHFDAPTCEEILRKVHAALAPSGRAIALEFIPNEDRVSPPVAASFSMVMLGSTPHGDAYTFPELHRMFINTGFKRADHVRHGPMPESLVVAYR